MGDKEENFQVTLEDQFEKYAAMSDARQRDGTSIDLYRIDFWLRQAQILEDRRVTMTDTGIVFFRFNKSEISLKKFGEFLKELADSKHLDLEEVVTKLYECGSPGVHPVVVPQYR